jgi:hypothetical protein
MERSGTRHWVPAFAGTSGSLRTDDADLGVRDAEITAHAEFRKRLYGYNVVPEARAAAMGLQA